MSTRCPQLPDEEAASAVDKALTLPSASAPMVQATRSIHQFYFRVIPNVAFNRKPSQNPSRAMANAAKRHVSQRRRKPESTFARDGSQITAPNFTEVIEPIFNRSPNVETRVVTTTRFSTSHAEERKADCVRAYVDDAERTPRITPCHVYAVCTGDNSFLLLPVTSTTECVRQVWRSGDKFE